MGDDAGGPREVGALGPAELHDADTAASWVHSRDEVTRFGGPSLPYPLTGADLLATSRDGWTVLALRDAAGATLATGSYRPGGEATRHLGRLLVEPARRGQGLGRVLAQALVADALTLPGIDVVSLNVYEDNVPALRLYESMGFAVVARTVQPTTGLASLRMELRRRDF